MKKRILAAFLAGAMVVSMLSGCGKSGDSDSGAKKGKDGETVIQFGIHVADPEKQEAVTYNIVQEFNKKYEGRYKVEFVAADTESHSKNMKLAASDGTLPQLFWMNSAEAPEYADGEYLLDMSDFLKEYSAVDQALDASVKEAFHNGIQYGLPYQCNVEGFFYNKDIFKELGVDEPKNGMTFEELLALTKKCNDKGYVTIAQGCKNSGFATWGYYAMLDRYGYSDYIQEILDGKKKFNNEDLLKCFDKLEQLGKSKAFANNMATQEYFDAKEVFTSGKAALFNTGAWDCAELDEKLGDKVGFWWGPTFSDSTYKQERAMKVPSAPICVSKAVEKDDAAKEAVYKFLEFYYSEDAAKLAYAGSVFPATNYEGIEAADGQYALGQVMASISEGWESPAAQPDQILSAAVQTQLYDSILGVLLGNYTPAEALDKVDEQAAY